MALPGVVVHHVEGDTTGLYGPLAQVTCGIVRSEDRVFDQILPAVDCSAMDRFGQDRDMGLSSPAPASLGSPRSIRQHDTGAESHRKTRHTSRRVRPTRVQDMSTSVLSAVAVSDQAPGAIIYDCRPPM